MSSPQNPFHERGNIFVIILVAIGLFAALSFTVSRNSNTKSEGILTRKQADLAASEILDYAQSVTRGVRRLQGKDCSENDMSAEPPPYDGSTAYDNANAPTDFSCHLFSTNGGAVSHRSFPAEWRTSGAGDLSAIITGSNCIPGVGTGDDGSCSGDGTPRESELMMVIPLLKSSVCKSLNTALNTRTDRADYIPDLSEFDGDFLDIRAAGSDTAHLENFYSGVEAACVQGADQGYYYKVLLAR